MTTRVAVVDDQALVRVGFAMVLTHQDDIDVVAEAGTGTEAIDVARTDRPDVILMDIRMPEMDGLEATERIVEHADWGVRVLILTTFEPDAYVYRALRAGASGFVLKDIPPEQLVSAVRTVADGGARYRRRGASTVVSTGGCVVSGRCSSRRSADRASRTPGTGPR